MITKRRVAIGLAAVAAIVLLPNALMCWRIASGEWKCYSDNGCYKGDLPEFDLRHRTMIDDTLYGDGGPAAILVDYGFRLF